MSYIHCCVTFINWELIIEASGAHVMLE